MAIVGHNVHRRILVTVAVCIATLGLKIGLYGIFRPDSYGFNLGLPLQTGPLRIIAIRNTVYGAGVLLSLWFKNRKNAGEMLVTGMWTSLMDAFLCWYNSATLWAILAHGSAGLLMGVVGWALQKTGHEREAASVSTGQ